MKKPVESKRTNKFVKNYDLSNQNLEVNFIPNNLSDNFNSNQQKKTTITMTLFTITGMIILTVIFKIKRTFLKSTVWKRKKSTSCFY